MGWPRASVRISDDGLTYRFTLRPEAEIPRRHAADRAGRGLVADDAEGKGPSDHHPAAARLRRRRGRRTTAPWSCASSRSAAATCRCSSPACRFFPAPITPSSRSTNRRSTFRSAAAPTRSAASRPATSSNIERVKDWWGAELPVAQGPEQFRHRPLRILPRPRGRLRRLHRQELSVPRGVHLAHLGDALRFSGLQGRPRQARRAARRYAVRRARLVHQYAARRSSRTAACARR